MIIAMLRTDDNLIKKACFPNPENFNDAGISFLPSADNK